MNAIVIRRCEETDFETVYRVINAAAQAYRGVIPPDCWHEPYMGRDELLREIRDGVVFWGAGSGERLDGVMGIQDRQDVTLIRHAYVRPGAQKQGVGTALLRHFEAMTAKPVLIGTWADASWAVSFYLKNGYRLVTPEEKTLLLRKYWSVPARQIETSVVLADSSWTGPGVPPAGR